MYFRENSVLDENEEVRENFLRRNIGRFEWKLDTEIIAVNRYSHFYCELPSKWLHKSFSQKLNFKLFSKLSSKHFTLMAITKTASDNFLSFLVFHKIFMKNVCDDWLFEEIFLQSQKLSNLSYPKT